MKVVRQSIAERGCKDPEMFEDKKIIGQGTFGQVLKAKHRGTGEYFALKRIKMDQEKDGVSTLLIDLLVPYHCHQRDQDPQAA